MSDTVETRPIARYGSIATVAETYDISVTLVRRTLATDPSLARKVGRRILIDLEAFARKIADAPHPMLRVQPDRPGLFDESRKRIVRRRIAEPESTITA